ncbi:ACIN1 [Acanthosepion pharaonis]|uniref:ACIN1 n=1 Tax=Acanthosepion pharaonis TaxID=158019 RepID=A0A812AYJ6_ACAPH|nr:ACIN1 [Sepia pharaonis]
MADDEDIHLDGKPVDDLRVIDLKRELDKRGLSKSGSKPQLVDRLKAQLLLEKLQSLPVDEEETVPNLKLQNDEVTGQSEFIKQYLEQQKKLFEMQREVKKRVEEEELQRKQRESEQSLDESSQESTENTDRVKEVLVDKDIQQTTIEENVSPKVDPKIREQSSPITHENDDINLDDKKRKDRTEEACPKNDKKKRKESWPRSLSSSSRSHSRSSSSSSASSRSQASHSGSHSRSRSRSSSSSGSSHRGAENKPAEPRTRSQSKSQSESSRSRSRSRSYSKSKSRSRSRSRSVSSSPEKKKQPAEDPDDVQNPKEEIPMETDKPPATEVEIAAATKEPEKEIEEKDEKKGKEEKEDGELAADSDLENDVAQRKEGNSVSEGNEPGEFKDHLTDSTPRTSLQLCLKLQRDETEGEEKSEEKPATLMSSSTSSVPRKRKWGTSAKPNKSTTIDISTDSLKGLIPEIKPSSIKEAILELSHDECSFSDHEEEKTEVKFRRTVQMKEEEEEIEPTLLARERVTDLDLELDKPAIIPVTTGASTGTISVEREQISSQSSGQQSSTTVVVCNKSALTTPVTIRRVSHQMSVPEPEEPMAARRSPSPAHNPVSKIIHVRNLVRPFTLGQLKELLKRTGTVVENGFWIDKIKSHCFAKYETEEEAILTRKALHGTKWPSSNPKILRVEYATDDEVNYYRSREDGPQDIIREIQQDVTVKAVKSTEKNVREIKKKEETKKVREWDRGKVRRRSRSASRSRSRSRSRERRRRAMSREKRERKEKKVVEEEAPAKLLDDLFRKTKTTPYIYWLPLTETQIAERERERRQRQLEREQRRRELEKQEEAERKKRREMEEKRKDRPDRERRGGGGGSGGGVGGSGGGSGAGGGGSAASPDRNRKDKRDDSSWRQNRRPASRSRSRGRRH